MDRPGHIPGGLISEVRNDHSRKLYLISTSPEIGEDYWSTTGFPLVERFALFGLIKKNVPDFNNQLFAIIRNNKQDAHAAHTRVKHVVSTLCEDDWYDSFPDPEPPDGLSKGAIARLRERLGYEPE